MTPDDIDIPMPILTPRLLIRPPRLGDGPALHEAKIESHAELYAYMPWAKEPSTLVGSDLYVAECEVKFAAREDIALFAFERDGGRLVVSTGIHRMDWKARTFEIGYWTRTSAAGRGYASETTNALLRYAFNALAARTVLIGHASDNEGSARVIAKCGFTKTDVRPRNEPMNDGRVCTDHLYERTSLDGLPPLHVTWGI